MKSPVAGWTLGGGHFLEPGHKLQEYADLPIICKEWKTDELFVKQANSVALLSVNCYLLTSSACRGRTAYFTLFCLSLFPAPFGLYQLELGMNMSYVYSWKCYYLEFLNIRFPSKINSCAIPFFLVYMYNVCIYVHIFVLYSHNISQMHRVENKTFQTGRRFS